MKGRSILKLLFVSLALFTAVGLNARFLQAGNPTGTIVGTVRDSTGAGVPGASVTLTHVATGQARTQVTNNVGNFSFPLMPVGEYALTVEQAGFQTYVQTGILLQVDQNVTLSPALKVGEFAEEITVTGMTAGVNLVTATMSEVVDQRRIVDLPLNGRNALQLQLLVPGAVPDTTNATHGQGQQAGLSVNGNRPASNYYLLDGADYVDSYLAVAPTFPSPDALQEFSVQTSLFTAEYGRNSGALINAVTKSGSNEFHGTLWEFIRNEKLNASDFFANRAGIPRPPFKLNQYGFTLGGPVKKDKTFFFAYWQGTNQRLKRVITIPTVLTPLQRPDLNPLGANFSQDCPGRRCPQDPQTRAPFPNNTIPPNRIDPVALNFVKEFMPLPNSGRRFVFLGSQMSTLDNLDEHQFAIRIDHFFSEQDRIFGRYFFNDDDATGLANGSNIPGITEDKLFRNQSLALNWTHMFSPNILNTVTFGFNRLAHFRGPTERHFGWEDLGGTCSAFGCGVQPEGNFRMLRINISGSALASGSTFEQNRTTFHYSNVLSWVTGKHTLKFGADIRQEGINRFENFRTDPQISFNGQFTSNSLSDFLLGLPNFVGQDGQVRSQLRHNAINFFVMDTFKVLPNLSLDVGLRWEPYLPPVDELNDQIAVDLTFTRRSTFYPNAPPGLLFPGSPEGSGLGEGDEGVPRGLFPIRWANFAPRIGIAWDPFQTGKTSIRAGYGIFWDQIRLIGYNRFSTSQPFALSENLFSPGNPSNNFAPSLQGNRVYTNLGRKFPFPFIVPRTPEQRAAYQWILPALESFFNPDWNQGYVQQWNFSIEQEFLGDNVFSVAYVGNHARHLWASRDLNPAVPQPLTGPGAVNAATQRARTNQRRPLFPLGYGILRFQDNFAFSNYHSLQLSLKRRMSRGVSLLASYVWSKFIDVVSMGSEGSLGPRDPFNLFLDRGLSDNDVAGRFVVSYIWELPRLTGRRGIIGQIVNGWQINGITVIQGGTPLTIRSGRDNSLTGIGSDTADPVPGIDPLLDTGRPTAQLIEQYFNTNAFTFNALGTPGAVGRNTLRGPGLVNFDFALFKNFELPEPWGRIQFRSEYFNIFNNVNLGNPGTSVASGSFGKINGARDPRFIQFGLKYIF